MSPSTRENRERPPDSCGRVRAGARRSHDAVWYAGSIVLHLGIALALWFTPARELLLNRADPTRFEVTARAERIEEMVQHLRDREADMIREKVEELLNVESVLSQILDEKHEQFAQWAVELAEDAAETALKAQAEALAAQERALKAEQKTLAEQSKLTAARRRLAAAQTPEDQKSARSQADLVGQEARKAQARVRDAQAQAGDAQREATQALSFARQEFDAARQRQDQANAAQRTASETQDAASTSQEQSIWARKTAESADRGTQTAQARVRSAQQRADEAQRKADKAKTSVRDAEAKLQALQAKAKQAEAELSGAQKQADAAKAQAEKTKTRQDRAKAKDAARQVTKLRAQISGAQREAQRAKAGLATLQRRAQDAEKQAPSARERAKAAEAQAVAATERAKQARGKDVATHARTLATQARAEEAQTRAKEAQREAVIALKKAIQAAAKGATQTAAVPPDASRSAVALRPALSPPQSLPEGNIADLYDEAVKSEGRIAEQYRHVHATEVAMVRRIPLGDALRETVVPKTKRPQLNRALLTGRIRSAAAAEAHRREVDKADQEVTSMVAAAHRFLGMARGPGEGEGEGEGTTVSLASIKAASAHHDQMRELAAEDASARYKDLSGAMKHGAAAGASAAGAGAGAGKAKPPKPSGRKTGRRYSLDPWPVGKDPKAIPGRKILTRAVRSPKGMWVYVDSWYTIGPFPNPNRRNIDTQFPPESVIDFDATYRGKGGRAVRWQFLKSANAMVIPSNHEEYGIWYAYTDLWFEEPMDLQIAVGSDDNSRLWIEGQLVWISGRQLKPWRADEGYRTVHFKKGLNRVLFRVENGWREIAFSFLICLKRPRRAE